MIIKIIISAILIAVPAFIFWMFLYIAMLAGIAGVG